MLVLVRVAARGEPAQQRQYAGEEEIAQGSQPTFRRMYEFHYEEIADFDERNEDRR